MTEKAEKASNGSTMMVLNCLHSRQLHSPLTVISVHTEYVFCATLVYLFVYQNTYISCWTVPTSDIQMCTELNFTFIYWAHTINCSSLMLVHCTHGNHCRPCTLGCCGTWPEQGVFVIIPVNDWLVSNILKCCHREWFVGWVDFVSSFVFCRLTLFLLC